MSTSTPNSSKQVLRGSFYVILSGILFGLMPMFTRIAYSNGSNAYTAAFWRFLMGSGLIFLYLQMNPREKILVGARQLLQILGLSVFYAVTPVMLYVSYDYIDSGLATTLHFTYPVAVIVLSALIFRTKAGLREMICLFLCLGGILMMYTPGENTGIFGMILAAASGLVYSFYIIFLGRSRLKEISAMTITFWMSLFAALEIGIMGWIQGEMTMEFTASAWMAHIMLAVLATFFAVALFQQGLFLCGSVRASLLSTFEPLTGVVVGIVVLHEVLTGKLALGIFLILFASVLLVAPDSFAEKIPGVKALRKILAPRKNRKHI